MANMHLVTGYAGQEHITALDQGAFNAALIGRDQFVLDVGNALAAQVISNNQIRILDGELMMQGRFVRLDPDTYVDLNIDNGVQGMKRNDLIAARYTKNASTGFEAVDLVVIKGTAAASDPADPAHTEGDMRDRTTALHDFPLWRIPLDGLNVGEPVALFGEPFMDSMRTLPEIRRAVESIHAEVDKQLEEQDAAIDEKIASLDEYTKEEVLTNTTKTAYGLGSTAVPNDVFALIQSKLGGFARIAAGTYSGANAVLTSSSPKKLNLGFTPKFFILHDGSDDLYYLTYNTASIRPRSYMLVPYKNGGTMKMAFEYTTGGGYKKYMHFTFANNAVTFYGTTEDDDFALSAADTFNASGKTYYYIAIG